MFQAMPKVALAPLIIVWFGLGLTSKVVNAALVAFFPLMVNTIVGLRSADEDRVNLMRSLAASRWQIFWMLQLPNAMPYIFAGLEIAMIFALIGAIVAEFVGAQSGLGMLIQSMNFTMDVAGPVLGAADPVGARPCPQRHRHRGPPARAVLGRLAEDSTPPKCARSKREECHDNEQSPLSALAAALARRGERRRRRRPRSASAGAPRP